MAGLRVLVPVPVPAEIRQWNRPTAAELRGNGECGAARGACRRRESDCPRRGGGGAVEGKSVPPATRPTLRCVADKWVSRRYRGPDSRFVRRKSQIVGEISGPWAPDPGFGW
jgi:hypothetical protein